MRTTKIFFMFISLLHASCVSVNIGSTKVRKAEGVHYSEPKAPFTQVSREEVDAAWRNSRTGNVISFLSDCQDPTDPPLDQIVKGVLSGLTNLDIKSNETLMVQGREGKRVLAQGRVDGVPSSIDLLVFKRNHCIYVLSYVGVDSAFEENRSEFNSFIKGFRAP